MTTLKQLILFVSLISLSGCATNLHSSSPKTTSAYVQGELNAQTVFDILSAELAAKQNQYPYTLQKYLKQAELTKDPLIAKRAVRIAQYLRDTIALYRAVELWLAASPSEVEPNQLMANLLLSQGKFDQARPHFDFALNKGRKQMLILLSTEIHRMEKDELESYIQLINDAQAPADLKPHLLLTKALLERGLNNDEAALSSLNKALTLSDDLPTAHFQKADILKSLKRYDDSLLVVENFLKQQPDSRQFSALQIQLLFLLKKNKQALQIIDILQDKSESDHQLLNYLALTAFDFDQLDISEQILEKLLHLFPQQSSPHYFLGAIAERRKEIPQAIEHYLKVLDGNNVITAHNRVLNLFTQDTDLTRITQITDQAITRNPEQTTNYRLAQADWLNRHNANQKAISVLSQSIALDPENTELLYSRAMYLEPLNFPAAERDFKRILTLDPDNAVVLNAFGYTLTLRTSRFEEALTLIDKALQISPDDPATLDSMGWVLFKLKRYDEAVEFLNTAFEQFKDPEVASHLISVLASQKRLDDATKIFDLIKASHPDSKFLEDARLVIENNQ